MRRFLLWIWLGWLAPMAALALTPAEPPPADFPGRQYIDSIGCVFQRGDDGGWTARLARDGAPICGYPPSLSVRGLNGRPRLQALDPDAGKSRAELVHEQLGRLVMTELRPGELVSDPRPPEALPDMGPEPTSTAPLDALKTSLRAAPVIQAAMGRDLQPNLRLCRLLGHDRALAPDTTGRDPTQGFCGALTETQLSRLAFARPVTVVAAPAAAVTAGKQLARNNGKGQAVRAAPASSVVAARPLLIPASARHVQVGTFAGKAEGMQMATRVARLGYPVLRGRLAGADGGRVILAGPFVNRQAIIQALDRIRRAGFADAFVR